MSSSDLKALRKAIRKNANIESVDEGRVVTTPSYYAYLKIADGCDNFCSYCLIPYIRGRYRSRDMDSIIKEANSLVKNGAKELILVAQDVAKYGEDLYKENKEFYEGKTNGRIAYT